MKSELPYYPGLIAESLAEKMNRKVSYGLVVMSPEDNPPILEYASRSQRPRRSFYSVLSLAMALVVVFWLYYVEYCRPRYHMGELFWQTLWYYAPLPGAIGIGSAVIGLLQTGRKRYQSIIAIVIIVAAYILLTRADNFA